jgi:hypothetical protein
MNKVAMGCCKHFLMLKITVPVKNKNSSRGSPAVSSFLVLKSKCFDLGKKFLESKSAHFFGKILVTKNVYQVTRVGRAEVGVEGFVDGGGRLSPVKGLET